MLIISLKKTNHTGTGRRSTAGHYHRRLWTRCCLPVHLPWLHVPSLTTSPWTQKSTRGLGRQLSNSHSSHGSSVDRPHAVCEDKYGGLQCLCYQHIDVSQRDMDIIYRAGEKAQHIPPEKHPPYPGYILAAQNNQRWCPVSCWAASRYIHSA